MQVADLTRARMRSAFAAFADSHAPASIRRCWSTWHQYLGMLVGQGLIEGNPMAAVPRPKHVKGRPKHLDGMQADNLCRWCDEA